MSDEQDLQRVAHQAYVDAGGRHGGVAAPADTEPETPDALAKAVYGSFVGGRKGKSAPPWEQLPEATRAVWRTAIASVPSE